MIYGIGDYGVTPLVWAFSSEEEEEEEEDERRSGVTEGGMEPAATPKWMYFMAPQDHNTGSQKLPM